MAVGRINRIFNKQDIHYKSGLYEKTVRFLYLNRII